MSKQTTILSLDGGSQPTSPHQFVVREIPLERACLLNSVWHSRLPIISVTSCTRCRNRFAYGFYYQDECWAVAIWTSPIAIIKDNDRLLELRRYAIRPGCPPNTATWGLGVMVRLIRKKYPQIKRLISYQDTAVHKGTIYKAGNWRMRKWCRQAMGISAKKGRACASAQWEKSRKEVQAPTPKIRWEYDLL